MRPSQRSIGLVFASLLFFACAAQPVDEELGDSGLSALSGSTGARCDRQTMLGGASGERRSILDRGFRWLDARVPYSQARTYESYRTDCSGFLSMCWQLGRSETTATFAQYAALSSFDSLQPGDGLVRRSSGSGHAVLFVGWSDRQRTTACVLHEAGSQWGMRFDSWSVSNLRSNGYRPIRKNGLSADAPGAGCVATGGAWDSCDSDGPMTNGDGDLPLPPVPPDGPNGLCRTTGSLCAVAGDCCSGDCAGGRCQDLPLPPLPPASSTSSGAGGSGGFGACGGDGQPCTVDRQCCGNLCAFGQCVEPYANRGTGSTGGFGGGPPTFCSGPWALCTKHYECCSGSCFAGACD